MEKHSFQQMLINPYFFPPQKQKNMERSTINVISFAALFILFVIFLCTTSSSKSSNNSTRRKRETRDDFCLCQGGTKSLFVSPQEMSRRYREGITEYIDFNKSQALNGGPSWNKPNSLIL
jgi:hypothetical protein